VYQKRGLLWKLERKIGKIAIRNLMTYIVITMGVIFAVDIIMPHINLYELLMFSTHHIMQGEIWRVITFIFLPPNAQLIFIIFALYFYYLIGGGLENEWGSFKFNVFYLCGMLGTIAAGLITGFATNFYLNLSLFFAFAILYPNFEVRLFLILPVKMKWLALLNIAFYVYQLVVGTWSDRVALLVSIANLGLFFGKDFVKIIQRWHRKNKWKRGLR